ncbi:RNA-directed DNA polymerase, eukaryota, reverse transcriptase zinc-binding domain protein [Tanacetum coccineum]
MTRLELFRLKSMWGNINFDYAYSKARGRSGGLISMWDPNMFSKDTIWCDDHFIIVKGHWNNAVGDCFMINIYGPQESSAKSHFWNRIADFMNEHNVKFILFFVYEIGLIDLPIGVIDRMWSDHSPILLHVKKADFGPSPFKFYNLWLNRDDFGDLIKSTWSSMDTSNRNSNIRSHEKLRGLKTAIKKWHAEVKKNDKSKKCVILSEIKDIEKKIDEVPASTSDRSLPQVIDKVVSKEQSAFISGRQILDGPLIISEISGTKKEEKDVNLQGLYCALSNAVSYRLIRGIKLGSSDITLSHLFYADDVVITTNWNSRDIDNIIRVLHVFYLASDLRINIHKSNIYGTGVSNDEISYLASRTGCAAGFFPFTYLGLPIGANMNLTSSWNILIDRFQKRLSSWKANLLSIGGRLTPIKAVLGSLGIYYLSIFKAPESILNTLESLRGLNIGSLKAFNPALLQKWRWRMFSSPNTLWVNNIKALHGQDGGLDNQGCNFNGIWSRIVGTSNFLHSKDIIPLNSFRFKSLADDAIFSVRSSRRLIDSKLIPSILPSTSWDNILPRKVNIFLWRLSLDRLPHRLNLSSRGIDIPTISCSSCNGNVESADHIFFACDLAKDVWSLVRKWCDLSSPSFASYVDWKSWFCSWQVSKDRDGRFLVVQAFVFYLEL